MLLAILEKREVRLACLMAMFAFIMTVEVTYAFELLKAFSSSQAVNFVRVICSPIWVIWAVIEIFTVISGQQNGISLKDLFAKIFYLLLVLAVIVGYKSLVGVLEGIAGSTSV